MPENSVDGSQVDINQEVAKILLESFDLEPECDQDIDNDPKKESYIVESCNKCENGWLKRVCKNCNGTGKVENETCNKCRGKGRYILRPTKYYSGKKCFRCNGKGKKIIKVPKKFIG